MTNQNKLSSYFHAIISAISYYCVRDVMTGSGHIEIDLTQGYNKGEGIMPPTLTSNFTPLQIPTSSTQDYMDRVVNEFLKPDLILNDLTSGKMEETSDLDPSGKYAMTIRVFNHNRKIKFTNVTLFITKLKGPNGEDLVRIYENHNYEHIVDVDPLGIGSINEIKETCGEYPHAGMFETIYFRITGALDDTYTMYDLFEFGISASFIPRGTITDRVAWKL